MRTAPSAIVLLLAAGLPASAQTVDYNAFEQIFGEPVTTSATGKPQKVSDAPADMEIVTASDIEHSGADNIPDVLRFVAGIDVRQYSQLDAAVGIRGNNTALNPRVLVLLDGRQVYEDDYGLTVWPLIPVAMSEIRQIEIIKGPSAALYGFNAVSGVINIVTFDPMRDKMNTASVRIGTQSQTSGEAVATWQIPNRLGVRLSATGFRSTEFTGYGDNISTRQQPQSGNVALDIRYRVAPNVEWDVSGSDGSLDTGYFVDLGVFNPYSDRANSVRSLLSADTAMGLLQFDLYRNENRAAETVADNSINFREDVTVAKVSDLLKLGSDHTLRFGLEFRDNSIASSKTFNGHLGYTIWAGSMMWNWQILPRLSLTNAVRLDELSLSHTGAQFDVPSQGPLYRNVNLVEPSFNSGLVYRPTDIDTVRLTAARAIQLPSLIDFGLGQSFVGGAITLAGNPGLQPSAVTNYELDYDRALHPIGAILRLATFIQQTDTTIGSPFGSFPAVLPTGQVLLTAQNYGHSREAGGEVGLRSDRGSPLRWNLSYAIAAVHDSTPESVLLFAPSVSFQRQTPVNSVIVGLGHTWRRLDVDFQAKWQSRYVDTAIQSDSLVERPVYVPNYITVNARVAYRINPHVTLSAVAEQLNGQRITEQAGLQVDRRILAGLKVRF